MPVTRAHAADDRRPDRFQSIVVDQTVAMAGVDQAIDDEFAIEFAASDQLGQTKGATVERVIATTGSDAGERFGLTPERRTSVGVRLATWSCDARARALRDRLWARARELH